MTKEQIKEIVDLVPEGTEIELFENWEGMRVKVGRNDHYLDCTKQDGSSFWRFDEYYSYIRDELEVIEANKKKQSNKGVRK